MSATTDDDDLARVTAERDAYAAEADADSEHNQALREQLARARGLVEDMADNFMPGGPLGERVSAFLAGTAPPAPPAPLCSCPHVTSAGKEAAWIQHLPLCPQARPAPAPACTCRAVPGFVIETGPEQDHAPDCPARKP